MGMRTSVPVTVWIKTSGGLYLKQYIFTTFSVYSFWNLPSHSFLLPLFEASFLSPVTTKPLSQCTKFCDGDNLKTFWMVHFILQLSASVVVVFYFLCNCIMTGPPEMIIPFKIPSVYLAWTISDYYIPLFGRKGRRFSRVGWNGIQYAVMHNSKGKLFLDIWPRINIASSLSSKVLDTGHSFKYSFRVAPYYGSPHHHLILVSCVFSKRSLEIRFDAVQKETL